MTALPGPGLPGPGLPGPGAHGGDGSRIARALGIEPGAVLDLSASMNPFAPDLNAVVGGHLDALGRYPDPVAATASLAAALDVDVDRVLLTNGGAEAIALVGSSLRRGWIDEPDFSLYARHLEVIDPAAPRWRSDPHNPTGRLAGVDARADVWDEAFFPLATGRWTSGRAETGAIVVGSLTKLFACPGLRIGFVLVPPGSSGADLRRQMGHAQPRWAVNGLVCAALPDLIATADLGRWTEGIGALRADLVEDLARRGMLTEPSDANYVLVRGASGLRDKLATRAVAVRDCASFGLPDHVRIAVPDDDGRQRLMDAIDDVMGEGRLR